MTAPTPDDAVDHGDHVDVARVVRLGLLSVVGVVAVGVLAGIVWGLLTPGVTGVVVTRDRAGALGADTTHRFDALALFACITFVAGVLGGVGVWRVRALRGPVGAVVSAAGAMLGAAGGAWIGGLVAGVRHPGRADTPVGRYFQSAPSLRLGHAVLDTAGGIDLSWAIVVVAPIGALLAGLVLLLTVGRADLGVPPRTPTSTGGSGRGAQGGELVGDPQTAVGEPVERGRTTS